MAKYGFAEDDPDETRTWASGVTQTLDVRDAGFAPYGPDEGRSWHSPLISGIPPEISDVADGSESATDEPDAAAEAVADQPPTKASTPRRSPKSKED